MGNEEYWYQEWLKASEKSTFSQVFPKASDCWDNSAYTYDLGMGNSLERVDAVLEELGKLGYSKENLVSALDIGSGTGSYTIPLAGMVGNITAIDCSENMNACLRVKTKSAGIKNVSIITADFMEYCFLNTYDLVIGSMNPGLYHPRAFEKMVCLTNKILVYVGIIPETRPCSDKKTLEELLFDVKLTHGGSNDVKYPYEILKAKGYHPYIREVSCKWKYYEEKDTALNRMQKLYEKLSPCHEDWKMCLQRYIDEISSGAHITRKGDYKLGILICECLN